MQRGAVGDEIAAVESPIRHVLGTPKVQIDGRGVRGHHLALASAIFNSRGRWE